MFLSGTRLTCECAYTSITGYLDRDEEDLDGVFVIVSDDDGKRYKIKGWLWTVEIEEPEPDVCLDRPIGGNVWQATAPLPLY